MLLDITMHVVLREISSRMSSNSEANASELVDNLEEKLPRLLIAISLSNGFEGLLLINSLLK